MQEWGELLDHKLTFLASFPETGRMMPEKETDFSERFL